LESGTAVHGGRRKKPRARHGKCTAQTIGAKRAPCSKERRRAGRATAFIRGPQYPPYTSLVPGRQCNEAERTNNWRQKHSPFGAIRSTKPGRREGRRRDGGDALFRIRLDRRGVGMCRVEGELFIKLMKEKGGGRTGFGVGILAGL